MIKGIDVTLLTPRYEGIDPFNKQIVGWDSTAVHNVLVAPMSDQEVLETYNLTGRKGIYQLGIPKGDNHDWTAGNRVIIWDKVYRIIGYPLEGIGTMIPLEWNKKVRVERYEQGWDQTE